MNLRKLFQPISSQLKDDAEDIAEVWVFMNGLTTQNEGMAKQKREDSWYEGMAPEDY